MNKAPRVIIIGDILVDETWHCEVKKISPEAPVPVCELIGKTYNLGGAGNVAMNVRALAPEAEVTLLGRMPADFLVGGWTAQYKINCLPELIAHKPNTKLRVVDHHTGYHIVRVDNEETSDSGRYIPLSTLENPLLRQADAIIFSDYCKGTVTEELIRGLRAQLGPNCISFADTRQPTPMLYSCVDFVTPNVHELESWRATETAWPGRGTQELRHLDRYELADTLAGIWSWKGILLTESEKGMTYIDRRFPGPAVHVPATNRHIVDVTGAGDTALAAFALTQVVYDEIPYPDRGILGMQLANIIAGDVCLERGVVVPKKTLEQYYEDYDEE